MPCKNSIAAREQKYGMAPGFFWHLLEVQGHLCAICKKREPTAIDHDHTTGKVRGLLCGTCNTGIGMLGDSAETVRAALAYLEDELALHEPPDLLASLGEREDIMGTNANLTSTTTRKTRVLAT